MLNQPKYPHGVGLRWFFVSSQRKLPIWTSQWNRLRTLMLHRHETLQTSTAKVFLIEDNHQRD